MKKIFSIFILISCFSCKTDNKTSSEKTDDSFPVKKEEIISVSKFQNEITVDTLLEPLGKVVPLELSNNQREEEVFALCSCAKDKKNNIIKIQLTSGIPTKKELDSTGITDKSGGRLSELMDLGGLERIDGQFKYLTIVLKDSLVKSIDLHSKSTELEYNGSDFKSMKIEKYTILISTFDYSIASDVYGNFKLRLPEEYGYFKNDTILKGHFECNNWRISLREDIKNWDIQEWHKKKNASRGFRVE